MDASCTTSIARAAPRACSALPRKGEEISGRCAFLRPPVPALRRLRLRDHQEGDGVSLPAPFVGFGSGRASQEVDRRAGIRQQAEERRPAPARLRRRARSSGLKRWARPSGLEPVPGSRELEEEADRPAMLPEAERQVAPVARAAASLPAGSRSGSRSGGCRTGRREAGKPSHSRRDAGVRS